MTTSEWPTERLHAGWGIVTQLTGRYWDMCAISNSQVFWVHCVIVSANRKNIKEGFPKEVTFGVSLVLWGEACWSGKLSVS